MVILLEYVLSNFVVFLLVASGIAIGWVARSFPEQQRAIREGLKDGSVQEQGNGSGGVQYTYTYIGKEKPCSRST